IESCANSNAACYCQKGVVSRHSGTRGVVSLSGGRRSEGSCAVLRALRRCHDFQCSCKRSMHLFNSLKAPALGGLLLIAAAGCGTGQGWDNGSYPYNTGYGYSYPSNPGYGYSYPNPGYGYSYPYNSGYGGAYVNPGNYQSQQYYNPQQQYWQNKQQFKQQYRQNKQQFNQQYQKNQQIYNQQYQKNLQKYNQQH